MDELIEDAFSLLETANELEESSSIEAASHYLQACYLMKRFLAKNTKDDDIRLLLKDKIQHYEVRADQLLRKNNDPRSPMSKMSFFTEGSSVIAMPPPPQTMTPVSPRYNANNGALTPDTRVVNSITESVVRANSRLSRAIDLDEKGQVKQALHIYLQASELYLETIKTAKSGGVSRDIVLLLKKRLTGALERVEELKAGKLKRPVIREPLQQDQHTNPHNNKNNTNTTNTSTKQALTQEEVQVLLKSSTIASGLFLPWSQPDALKLCNEHKSATLFTDNTLKLNARQQQIFHRWIRPTDWQMIKIITPYSIKQQFVTDCSFIASLCICAAFERHFGKPLITSIIYPQDGRGMPVVSKNGKYMVKLWLNGVARQVVIDDRLPCDRYGNLLCSTTQKGELWVSLIEKAYMKLCGGYDFPGSNSGVDLFCLTGWIPERIFFPKNPHKVKDHETPAERVWERLYGASSYGDCLITMSTSTDIQDSVAERVGLVTGHAYAVLAVQETSQGVRLLQLKNPWAHKSWKGKYSSRDRKNWTTVLCHEIGYNPELAAKHDDGVFWISWDDILVYFQNVHLSWNPELFSHRTTVHGYWKVSQGPAVDTFNVGDNPQYIINFSEEAIKNKPSVWILLSRHVTKQEQEGMEVNDYLTVHLYRNLKGKGRSRIWYPSSKTCVFTGAYTNNPHVLIRYDLVDSQDKHLSLVLSQYKKSHDLGYTLSCFCTSPFTLGRPEEDLPVRMPITGRWVPETSGGPPSNSTFGINPQWCVTVPKETKIQLRMKARQTFAINCMMVLSDGNRIHRLHEEPIIDSGNYRHGFAVAETATVPPGNYTLICSSFETGISSVFSLDLFSSTRLRVAQI